MNLLADATDDDAAFDADFDIENDVTEEIPMLELYAVLHRREIDSYRYDPLLPALVSTGR
jgi:hypothetical protein